MAANHVYRIHKRKLALELRGSEALTIQALLRDFAPLDEYRGSSIAKAMKSFMNALSASSGGQSEIT